MSAPSPLIIQELIDQLLPIAPSTSAPLHLLPKLQGSIALLRYWNAHLGSEIRRAARSKSIMWDQMEEKDRKTLKRMTSVRYQKDFDEKGEAFLLILASWHIQHHLLTNPRAHQYSLRLVNLWFPPSPLPSSYFIGEPSILDPKTVLATNTKFAKFRTNALAKVQGVQKFVNRAGGFAENLTEALKREIEAPTISSLRFDLRLQWESESVGLLNWAKKVVYLWTLMNRMFPLLPEEVFSEKSSHGEEIKSRPVDKSISVTSRIIPEPTILSFSTPDHSVPLRRKSVCPYTDELTYPPLIYSFSPTASTKMPYFTTRSDNAAVSHTKPKPKPDDNSEPDLGLKPQHFPYSSSPASPLVKPQTTALLDDFVADSQSFGSLSPSVSLKKTITTNTPLEDISDIEIISPGATSRTRPIKPLIPSPPSTSYPIHTDSRSRKLFHSSRASPQQRAAHRVPVKDARVLGSIRKSGGRPRLSFEPDFDLSIVPPEPKVKFEPRLHSKRMVDDSSERLSAGAARDVRPLTDHDNILPGKQLGVIELVSSSPIDEEAEDDESLPVADSQEAVNDESPDDPHLKSSPISSAHPRPEKVAAMFSFPDLSPRTKRAHRSLMYLPSHHAMYSSSSGSDSDPISDSSDDEQRNGLIELNQRKVVRAPSMKPIDRVVRHAGVGLKRKRDMDKEESEESEHEEERFWLGKQRGFEEPAVKKEEKDLGDQLYVFTQRERASSLRLSANSTTSSSAFDSNILYTSSSVDGRDSESESAVSSLIADDPTYSSSSEKEDETTTTTTMAVTGSIDMQDSQETNSSLGYIDIPLGPVREI